MSLSPPPSGILACDWGTTHLRAFRIAPGGEVVQREVFPLGVSRLVAGEAAEKFRDEVRIAMGAADIPAILCGMVGSDLGWQAVPYVACPADLAALAALLCRVSPGERGAVIVPGLKCARSDGSPDVMRGEETQILGWVAQESGRENGSYVICHPGTHAKWVLVQDGSIRRFITAMTGELFGLLRTHSILRTGSEVDDPQSFDEGVAASGDGCGLAARLFTARSRKVTGTAPRSDASYLSGLLIGAEIASLPRMLGAEQTKTISLLGDVKLCGWYARAMARLGLAHAVYDGEAAVIAGLVALARSSGIV